MEFYTLIRPLGIAAYGMTALTVFSGLRRWKIKYHRILAGVTILLASMHALTVLAYYL